MSTEQKRKLIDRRDGEISISRQCELLDLARASLYYESTRNERYNEQLMRLIDEQYTRTPFYGVPRMTAWLRSLGHEINPKRIRRLMRRMGLEAIYPKPRLSRGEKRHPQYPYLLKGLKIEAPNQVWAADITYIRLSGGFVYLVAIMDWYSRYVISWEVSVTLEGAFCLSALERAFETARPEIFNTDQGVQFTSEDFTGMLDFRGIRISMDGRGRCFDNIFVERLWRSVKYEEVYLKDYRDVHESIQGLNSYFEFYNHQRQNQSLDYQTPSTVHFGQSRNQEPQGRRTRGTGEGPITAGTPVALRAPSVPAVTQGPTEAILANRISV